MTNFVFEASNEQDTRKLGQLIGQRVTPGFVLGLNGTLGSGKTRLTQAIGIGLGIPEGQVVSPTFTLCTPHYGRLALVHLDAYRINSIEEVDELGLDELVEDDAFLVVEWAERIIESLPEIDLQIEIQVTAETARRFQFVANSREGQILLDNIKSQFASQT